MGAKLPDTCTIAANTIACVSDFDWWAAALALGTALLSAGVGVFAAVRATSIANRHQREEASKQRKIVVTAAIMRSAYNMVRSSHRDKAKMRDHASEFEINIRILSVELKPAVGQAFIKELHAWRRSIAQDCYKLPEIPENGDHDTPEIKDVRAKTSALVQYLQKWLHMSEDQLEATIEEMAREAARRWPSVTPEQRSQPRLAANSQGA